MKHRLLFIALLLAGCDPTSNAAGPAGTSAREVIATADAPEAIGPYSQGIKVGNRLYCAGQVGLSPETRVLVEGGIVQETRRAMENLRAVLTAGGFTFADVVQAQVFLADLNDYGAMNAVYGTFFEPGKAPPRAAVQVARLPLDARVEIMVVAEK